MDTAQRNTASLEDMYLKIPAARALATRSKRRIMLGTFVLSSGYYDAYYKRAKLLQKKIAGEFSDAFADCDVILTPTTPYTAFQIGENVDDPAQDVCGGYLHRHREHRGPSRHQPALWNGLQGPSSGASDDRAEVFRTDAFRRLLRL